MPTFYAVEISRIHRVHLQVTRALCGQSQAVQRFSFSASEENSKRMMENVKACCSSPTALCYWFVVSLVAWGMLSLIGIYWHPLDTAPAATCLFAMAIGCLANWLRNRSFHCGITGPLFLAGGIVMLLSGIHVLRVNTSWVWLSVFVGVGIAFSLEWCYAERSA